MKKILALLLSLIFVFTLTACGDKPTTDEENTEQEEQQFEQSEQGDSIKINEEEKDEKKEYDRTAWVKDNTSISFYLFYSDTKEKNELLTLKILDDKAVLYSKLGEDEEKPITIYEETADGVVSTSLIYAGDKKGAFQSLPKTEIHTLKEYLPQTGNVMMTFGLRGDKDNYKNAEFTGKTEYIGRKCDVIEKTTLTGKSTTYIDRETGIILKNETVFKKGEEETRMVYVRVTEFEYGKVSLADVDVDLTGFEMVVEGEEATDEQATAATTKTLAFFQKYLIGGEYTMEMKTAADGVEATMKSAFKGEMMYSESDMDGMKSIMVMKDGFQYIIDHSGKTVMKMQMVDNAAVADMFSDEAGNYETATASGTTEYNGKTYEYEEFTVEGETVQYLFDGDDLKIIKANVMGTESIVEILSIKKGADEKLFEIPEDYQLISY